MTTHRFPPGLLESLVNSSLDGILAFDLELRLTVWNPAMEEATGISATKAIGKPALELLPFLKDTNEDLYYLKALSGQTSVAMNRRYTIPEIGRIGYYDAIYSPLHDPHGKIIGGAAFIRDTTSQSLAEKAKTAAELKLLSVTRSSQDAIITCDENGFILSWSGGAAKIFEYTEAEAVGKNLNLILPEKYWKHYLPKHLSILPPHSQRRGYTQSLEFVAQRKTGSNLPIKVILSDWQIERQPFLSLVIRDMTDRKRIERIAEETQELYEALLSAQSDLKQGVAVVDIAVNKIIFANQAFCSMTGYTFDELKTLENMYALIAPSHREVQRKRVQRRISDGSDSDHYELALLTKSGEEIFIELAVKHIETSQGRASISLVRDISGRKLAEQALIASERQKSFIIDSAWDIITTFSFDETITSTNPAFEKILGYKKEDLLGKNVFNFVHPDDKGMAMKNIGNLFEGKSTLNVEIRLRASNGEYIMMEASSAPLIENGKVVGGISIIRDISLRKKQERALADERARLHAITDAIFEGLAFTENGILFDASDSFIRMFGYRDVSQVIGMRGEDFGVEPYRTQIRERLNTNASDEKPFAFKGLRKDGTTFNAEVIGRTYNYRGRICRVASIRYMSESLEKSASDSLRSINLKNLR